MRTARIAGLVSLALVGVFISAGPAAATTVGISKFKVAPAYASGGGSSVTFTAKTKNAASCRLKASRHIKGLPKAVNCADGSARKVVAIPASTANKARAIVFTFTATRGSLTATAHVTVHQDPALPKISSLTRSSKTAFANKATSVRFKAKVTHTKTCKLSANATVAGLPATAPCTSGSFAKTVSIPANPSAKARTITFTLLARNSIGKRITRTTTVSQPGASAPTVTLQPTPSTLTSSGGNLTIKATVAHAKTCQLTSSPSIGSVSGTCTSGTVTKTFSIPANTTSAVKSYKFSLKATGPGGIVTKSITMSQPSGPVQILTIGSSPASLTAQSTSITVNVTLKGATLCTMTSSPDKGSVTNASCAGGTFSHTFNIGANGDTDPRGYTFSISATGPGGSASGFLNIGQPGTPAPLPKVLSLTSSPANLQSAQTPVTVTATVSNATGCTLVSDENLVATGSGDCTGGSISRSFTVPANSTNSTKQYSFTVTANGAGGSFASETLTMTQPAMGALATPSITSITPSQANLTAASTNLTVTAAVSNAATCSLAGDHGLGTTGSQSCVSGSIAKTFAIPANTTPDPITYTFTVDATGVGGTASGTLTMTQPGTPPAAPQVVTMTSSPTAVTSAGGQFTIAATIAHGSTCTLTSTATIVSTTSSNCSAGSFGGVISLPANTTSTNQSYTATVHVTGPGGTATGTLTYTVPPAPPSASLSSSPKTLGSAATTLKVTGTIARGTTCSLSSSPNMGSKSGGCTSGTFEQDFAIPANKSGSAITYTFTLSVTGAGGSASATLSLTQPSS